VSSANPWLWAGAFLIFTIGTLIGGWAGWGRGWEHGHEDAELAAVQADTRRMRLPVAVAPGVPPEVAHEAWVAHTEQAIALTAPDPRTDTAWTRDMAADMDRWLAGLLDQHPATEEL
jgi:hypothetical protein